jgi:hypothetical protein
MNVDADVFAKTISPSQPDEAANGTTALTLILIIEDSNE